MRAHWEEQRIVRAEHGVSRWGLPLIGRGHLGGGAPQLGLVAALAMTPAALSFVAQRYLAVPAAVLSDLPEIMISAQQLMPVLSLVGLLVAGGFVPVALSTYRVCNGAWTLGQAAVIRRWFPTPGSPASARRR